MKSTMFYAALVLALLTLTGCQQKAPSLGAAGSNISDATAITGDAVSIDENTYGNGSGGLGNSSSDGFQSVYFAFGDYGISSDMEAAINKNVRVGQASGKRVKIEGNCDEFGTDEYNYALGLKRAKAVKDSMSAQGIDTSRMVMVSYGESNPVCTEASDRCYSKNRRVDLRLIK